MKPTFHKIISMLMALVVAASTMSFTVDMHYCGDRLVDTAIFGKVKSCGMEVQNPATKKCSITKKNCCSDQQIAVNGQDELPMSVDKISFEQQLFMTSYIFTYTTLFKGFYTVLSSHKKYKPPLVIRQIFKIDQTYLI